VQLKQNEMNTAVFIRTNFVKCIVEFTRVCLSLVITREKSNTTMFSIPQNRSQGNMRRRLYIVIRRVCHLCAVMMLVSIGVCLHVGGISFISARFALRNGDGVMYGQQEITNQCLV